MADTRDVQTAPPVQPDAISYRGIIWFLIVLVVTTLTCQLIVYGMFRVMNHEARVHDPARAPLAPPVATPSIDQHGIGGHLETGMADTGQPGLLVDEPLVLQEYRDKQDAQLASYGWIDQSAGTVRLPIDRAKALVLARGLPARSAASPAAAGAAAGAAKTGAAKSQPSSGGTTRGR